MVPKTKISPKEYNQFLETFQLKTIRLVGCSFNVNLNYSIRQSIQVNIKEHSKVTRNDNEQVQIELSYELNGVDDSENVIFSLTATYDILFSTEKQLPEAFFTIYKKTSLPMTTWPYFRELVANMISRAGLPMLTLPLVKR